MRFDIKTLLVAALIGAVVACSTTQTPKEAKSEATAGESSLKAEGARNLAADFSLKDSSGKVFKLSQYKGKVVLVNFWATWCVPCKVEIPWFIDFQQRFKAEGFETIGISLDDEGWEVVKQYTSKAKINYPVVLGDEVVTQKYGGVDALPMSFLLDPKGRIAAVHVGLVEKADYEVEIRELLRTKAAGAGAADGAEFAKLAAN
jgi:thiol-disulfide isomerase/thioredoxin